MTYDKTSNWSDCLGNNGNYIFRNMSEHSSNSRKRPLEDDSCEFMPLSKRINNLHINNSMTNTSILPDQMNHHPDQMNHHHDQMNHHHDQMNHHPDQMNHHHDQMNHQGLESSHNHNHNATDHGMSSPNSSSDSDQRPNYDPGVHPAGSNYYFDNKLLFELHLERVQRAGQQFPF